MCNVFSGHIVSDKQSKKFGEVIYKSGVHHEKDREEIDPKLKIVAWETKKPMSLKDGFVFTHSQGDLEPKVEKELMKLLESWAKKQSVKELAKSFLTVCIDDKQTDDYTIGNMSISCLKNKVSIITWIDKITQKAGYDSTQTAGYDSTQTAGDESTQIIYSDESYIILDGKNVTLLQIYDGKTYNLKHDTLFKNGYKKGDKFHVVKGKAKLVK